MSIEDIEFVLVAIAKSKKDATPEAAAALAQLEANMQRRHGALVAGETLDSLAKKGDRTVELVLIFEREQKNGGGR